MSYCRKCGAKLDEGAKFCRVCGAPVEAPATAQPVRPAPTRRRTRTPYIIPVAILIGVLLIAFFVAVVAFVPFRPVSFHQSNTVYAVPGIDTINLNFDADVAELNVIPTNLPNQLVVLNVSATGSTGAFGSSDQPVKVAFSNETSGNTMTVTSGVTTERWPTSLNLKIVCDLYVDRSAALNVRAQTSVGKVTMTPDVPVEFGALNLRTTTGTVEVSLGNQVTLPSEASFSTTTGSVQFTWNNAQVTSDTTINLATTTGSVNANITQSRALGGNVTLDAKTTTGSVDLGMGISGNVGAMLTSHSSLGGVTVDVQNFNGNKSPIYSSNYPSAANFIVNSETTTGGIHITAAYNGNSNSEQPVQEQVRDSVMNYIKTHHSETSQFMQNLTWTGGRVDRGLIVGAELYQYFSGGWNVTITYPVIPHPAYTVTADYTAPSLGVPYRVIWTGTWQDNAITETNYTFAQ